MMPLRREPLLWATVAVILGTTAFVYLIERPEHINALVVLLVVETTVTIVGGLYAIFINFAWHLNMFRGWFVRVPDLRGRWEGTLTPLDPDGEALTSISCTITIRQKLFSVSCLFETDKAESHSFAASAYLDETTHQANLVYVYRGWPQLSVAKLIRATKGQLF